MEFVCRDDDGDWYYDPNTKSYTRIKGSETRSKISGKYLPDPSRLMTKRKQLYPEAKETNISPTEATYNLWEHWNAIQQISN